MLSLLISLPAAGALPWLHTQGHDIVDENGRKVLLQGVGLGNWLLPEGYMWKFGEKGDRPRKIEKLVSDLIGPEKAAQFWTEFRKSYITEADIERISALGFNSVRPALNSRLFMTEGDNCQYIEEGFLLLDNLITWCGKHHLYVIIDMHAAPGGQTGANIDDSPKDEPELFTDPRNQQRLVDLWVKIATRYKDNPAVAAYDLLNEPLPKRTGAEDKFKSQLEPLYKRLTTAIRAVDKRHMITLEGADWANDWSVFSTRFDNNTFYQFHFYCWDRPTKLNRIDQYLRHRDRLNAPVWVGETGEKDETIYWGTTDYFEANNIGWSFWPWKKMDTRNTPYSIKLPESWDAIAGYSRGKEKPSLAVAEKAFTQLLQNIRLENCVYFPEVVNALFHRLPARLQAENYSHEGLHSAFLVHNPTQNSKLYRLSEPVSVVAIENADRRNAGQAIQLQPSEWTAYTVNSPSARIYTGTCKVRADAPSTLLELSIENVTQELSVETGAWTELKLKPITFKAGKNQLRLKVKTGTASVDWLEFKEN